MMSVLHVISAICTAPLLYLCRRYLKCPWGLYASPLAVAMAVVGLFLCFPAFFFFWKTGFFSIRNLLPKKNKFPSKEKSDLRQKTSCATYAKKTKVVSFRASKIFSLLLEHNSMSTRSPGLTVEKTLVMSSALARKTFLRMSRKESVSNAS